MGELGRGLLRLVWQLITPMVCGLSYVRERAALAWWIHACESLVGSVNPDVHHAGFGHPNNGTISGCLQVRHGGRAGPG